MAAYVNARRGYISRRASPAIRSRASARREVLTTLADTDKADAYRHLSRRRFIVGDLIIFA